ncbi:MAG: hypothetical protein U1G08_17790 [Verrucomicrobiota bacterium]
MSTIPHGNRWTISCRYSGGTNIARNQATGLSCSATESERAAVLGLAQKLRPGFPAAALRQLSTGIWTLAKPSPETAAIVAGKGVQ